ncbi:hypothetical protein ABBQ32_004062 [Trebouxia sp. C0010 RCD-2024]
MESDVRTVLEKRGNQQDLFELDVAALCEQEREEEEQQVQQQQQQQQEELHEDDDLHTYPLI